MANFHFNALDLIGSQLEKNKDRLGPLYRPLYILSGTMLFALLLATMTGMPIAIFSNATHIVFAQTFLVAAYFMLLLAVRQNIFDRFVFCTVLFAVLSAAPVAINVEKYFNILRDSNPDFADTLTDPPMVEIFSYGVIRGICNTSWAMPLLFYFYTFSPVLRAGKKEGVDYSLRIALWIALALQIGSTMLIVWLSGVLQRSFAPTAGAIDSVRAQVVIYQRGFLIFSVLYLGSGFLSLLVAKKWAGVSAGRILLVVVAGLLVVQLLCALALYNGRELNKRYPAALTSASIVLAYQSKVTAEFVFINPTYRNISRKKLGMYQIYSACHNPNSGKFTYVVLPAAEFNDQFEEYDLHRLKRSSRASLFCQAKGPG